MKSQPHTLAFFFLLALMALLSACALGQRQPEGEWIGLDAAKQGFALRPSGRPFTPWGFNYDRDYKFRLLEDYWDSEWATVESDFREMRELGANVVRVHLQFGKFMAGPDRPNPHALARLEQLFALCDRLGLYLDVTGLACYRKQDVPAWYDALAETQRWQAQANFWRAIARCGAPHPCVFAYDLMNEPLVPDKPLSPGAWLHPAALGGFHYVQYITLDPAGRDRTAVARAWIHQLAAAIRAVDSRPLVTVGFLPFPGQFALPTLAPDLDYLSVHLYPATGKLAESLTTLAGFCVGKPLVIEEIFPLNCSPEDLGRFLEQSRGKASGWIGFYWGRTPAELRGSKEIGDALTLGWLEFFQKANPNRNLASSSAGRAEKGKE